MNKAIKRSLSVFISVIIVVSLLVVPVRASVQAVDSEQIVHYNCELPEFNYQPAYSENRFNTRSALPSSYDARTENVITPVKDQGVVGSCGIFASIACLETAAYAQTGIKSIYSEESPRMIMSYRLMMKNNVSNNKGYFNNSTNGAWDFSNVAAYMSLTNESIIPSNTLSWVSPNYASDIPYTNIRHDHEKEENKVLIITPLDDYWPEELDSSYANAYASGFEWIEKDAVKQAVYEYGAVYASFWCSFGSVAYNEDTASYYSSGTNDPNHGIVIVGWDDNYSIDNFNSQNKPENPGAWLVKNSYGLSFGNDGYFWISYEDTSLFKTLDIAIVNEVSKVSKNEHMLAYDSGSIRQNVKRAPTNGNKVYIANVYDVSELIDVYGSVNKIMFYARNIGDKYKIYIAPANSDGSVPAIGDSSWIHVAGGENNDTVRYEGAMTVGLDTPFILDQDVDKYAFIIEFETQESDVEVVREVSLGRMKPDIYEGESFINYSGTWIDVITEPIYNDPSREPGNFSIRPTLVRRNPITVNSSLSSNAIYCNTDEVSVTINLNGNQLYSIRNNDTSELLREDVNFTRNGNVVTFNKSILTDEKTELVFEFTDGANQMLTIYPKALSDVTVSGKVAQGQFLTANVGYIDGTTPESGDLIYQWQSSDDGSVWDDISGANACVYTLTSNDRGDYIRCTVSVSDTVNNVLPETKYSASTATKVVRYGDADLDGDVDAFDSTEIQRYIANIIEFSAEQFIAADVTGDGVINTFDTTAVQRYIAGYITSFPVET